MQIIEISNAGNKIIFETPDKVLAYNTLRCLANNLGHTRKAVKGYAIETKKENFL